MYETVVVIDGDWTVWETARTVDTPAGEIDCFEGEDAGLVSYRASNVAASPAEGGSGWGVVRND